MISIASKSRISILAAAEQILAVFRSTQEIILAPKNPVQDYAAYIAALVFLEDFKVGGLAQSRTNVVFFLEMLQALSQSNPIAH